MLSINALQHPVNKFTSLILTYILLGFSTAKIFNLNMVTVICSKKETSMTSKVLTKTKF